VKEKKHRFEDNQKVKIKETGEIVTVENWWFIQFKPHSCAQYNIKEKPGTWFSEYELEEVKENVKVEKKMYSTEIELGLTYGQAMDLCIHKRKKIARPHWGGYWFVPTTGIEGRDNDGDFIMEKMIVASLRNGTFAPATPYAEDYFANDWMVVE
jgi:hypothetical protein